MRKRNALCVLPLLITCTGTVAGCAAIDEVRKCGYHGCPPDPYITAEVNARFDLHTELKPPNLVYVQTLNGVVYLSGIVSTGLQRATAVEIAGQVPGVIRVVDNIQLSYRDF
jgi:osmotically-inducible protein OsmY